MLWRKRCCQNTWHGVHTTVGLRESTIERKFDFAGSFDAGDLHRMTRVRIVKTVREIPLPCKRKVMRVFFSALSILLIACPSSNVPSAIAHGSVTHTELPGSDAGSGGSGDPAPPKPTSYVGPLRALPSLPGPHIVQIESLGDNEWLTLPMPAPDPKWGRSTGRSWGGKSLSYAHNLRGAFHYGEGPHAYVLPNGHAHDDLWFYDINQNRWLCLFPGNQIATFNERVKMGALRISELGILEDETGRPVPLHPLVHAWGYTFYDSHRGEFVFYGDPRFETFLLAAYEIPFRGTLIKEGADALIEQRKDKRSMPMGPWRYNIAEGAFKLERLGDGANSLMPPGEDYAQFLPIKDGRYIFLGRSGVYFYDPEQKNWAKASSLGVRPPGYDHGSVYDPIRNFVYMGGGITNQPEDAQTLYVYDVERATWTRPQTSGTPPRSMTSNVASLTYDTVNDRVLVFHVHGTFSLNLVTYEWIRMAHFPENASGKTIAAYYDPVLNAHFVFLASDGQDDGKMLVYRLKKP